MRALVDIADKQLSELVEIYKQEKRSRVAVVREAIATYIQAFAYPINSLNSYSREKILRIFINGLIAFNECLCRRI
jgi:metal-responsive CopG/Arc/MetJ family transcriptional regulator